MNIQKAIQVFRVLLLLPKFALCAFVGVCLCLSVFAFSGAVHAQEQGEVGTKTTKSLEDYLGSDAPDQQTLSPADLQKKQSDSMLDRLQDAILSVGAGGEKSNEQKSNEQKSSEQEYSRQEELEQNSDSLPSMKTRYEMKLEGFGTRSDSENYVRFNSGVMDPEQQAEQELEEEIRREAFDAAITGLFPLNPEQIQSLLGVYDKTQRAAQKPVHATPTPKINVATLALDPGVPPMTLQTAVGYVSTLNLLDITGAPWPIRDITWAGDFEVTEPEEGGHIIRIIPLSKVAYGNMSIRLLTLKTPITIMLKTGTDEVQYRVDARIPEYGPFAQAPLMEGGMERVAGNAVITSILDGVAPDNAKRLKISGVDGRTTAYDINGMVYVRTPLSLLSPGWEQSVSSADGMNVYALNETPVLLLSDRGEFLRANLSASGEL